MGEIDDLYREVILDHYRNPRNRGTLDNADIEIEGVNPLCGDQIQLTVKVKGDRVEKVNLDGKGCSISQSSGSMMTEALEGKSFSELQDHIQSFKKMMLEKGVTSDDLPDALDELAALEGVKKYPVRIKCALLPWNTLLQGIESFIKEKAPVKTKHQEE